MDSPSPEYGTYAARAAYWGDRVCRFCDHHNPAAAKFCNDCGSPLDLKPCTQCDAVNQQAATNCCKCGAEFRALTGATSTLPAANSKAPVGTTTDPAATVAPPLIAASAGLGGRPLKPGQAVAIATILMVGAYGAYWITAATPDVIEVVLPPSAADEQYSPREGPSVAITVVSAPVEPETTTALLPPVPLPTLDGRSAPQRSAPAPAAKRASAHQRPLPEVHGSVGKKLPAAKSRPPDARVGTPAASPRKADQRDPWQAMQVSLAHCGGDLMARIQCDQRVRRRFCEGHWGKAAECARIENDRGQ